MQIPLYTALTASIIMVLQMALMLMVGFARLRTNTNIGEGDNEEMLLAIRRHGNLAENSALFLVLLALGEMIAGSTNVILSLGVIFIIVRIAHAIGLSMGGGANAPRAVGVFGTLLTGVGAAVYATYAALGF